jgi:inorganic pyrophosphatase
MTVADKGRITGTIDLADGQSRDWKVVAAIGTKNSQVNGVVALATASQ